MHKEASGRAPLARRGRDVQSRRMRQLLLMRHAKSSWDDKQLPDHARPLNPRGRTAAAAMRAAMETLGLAPDLVLVSSALRTRQTLEALEPWAETPLIEPMDALYLADAPGLLKVLRGVTETVRSVLLIGHNPGLHELAQMLAGPRPNVASPDAARRMAEAFPTAALAEFAVPGPWWSLDSGGGRLLRFLTPREVEAAE